MEVEVGKPDETAPFRPQLKPHISSPGSSKSSMLHGDTQLQYLIGDSKHLFEGQSGQIAQAPTIVLYSAPWLADPKILASWRKILVSSSTPP